MKKRERSIWQKALDAWNAQQVRLTGKYPKMRPIQYIFILKGWTPIHLN